MSAEPLTPEEVHEWSTLDLREHTEGVSWSVLDRMIATVRAAEARARVAEDREMEAEQRADAERERAERYRAALPDAYLLDMLAQYHDLKDDERGYTGDREVQRDLRAWARAIRAALAADDQRRTASPDEGTGA